MIYHVSDTLIVEAQAKKAAPVQAAPAHPVVVAAPAAAAAPAQAQQKDKKRKKDPNAPKKPMSAFFCF